MRLIPATDARGKRAILSVQATARSSEVPGATTSATNPSSSARWASTFAPNRRSCAARMGPTRSTSREPPPHPVDNPIAA